MRCDAPASTRTSLRSVRSSFAEIVRRTHRDRMHDSPRARHAAQLLAVLWTSPDVHNMWGDVALVMELAAGGGSVLLLAVVVGICCRINGKKRAILAVNPDT